MTINVPSDQATTVVMSFTAADPQGRIVAVLAGVWVGSHPDSVSWAFRSHQQPSVTSRTISADAEQHGALWELCLEARRAVA
jgi:hypothetical protein